MITLGVPNFPEQPSGESSASGAEYPEYRVLLVSYDWPPRNAMATHRAYGWAKAWAAAGINVSVLTAKKHTFDAPLDLLLPSIDGVAVTQVGYSRMLGLLASWGMRVLGRTGARRLQQSGTNISGRTFDPRRKWARAANRFVDENAESFDAVVSTFGPSAAHEIAASLKRKNSSIYWVADFRDLGPELSTDRSLNRSSREPSPLAGLLQKADLVTTVSPGLSDELAALLACEVRVYPNGFDFDEAAVRERLREKPSPGRGTFRIVYTGSMDSESRDPSLLLETIIRLENENKVAPGRVILEVYGSRVSVAKKLAADPKFAPYVCLKGHVSRDEAVAAQQRADLLLLLESSEKSARGVMTGKVFEYVASGRPILCVGSRPSFDLGLFLQSAAVGQAFREGDLISLQTTLLETLGGEGLFETYDPDIELIVSYSRQRQSVLLLSEIVGQVQARRHIQDVLGGRG